MKATARLRRTVIEAGATVIAAVLEPLLRRTSAQLGVAVVYHRLSGQPAPRGRFFVRPLDAARFERDLRFLAGRYRLVRASELQDAAIERRRGQPFPLAITFDDDDESYARIALPALARHGAPGTFFLTGAALDGPDPFWWEDLDAVAEIASRPAGELARELGVTRPDGREPETLDELGALVRALPSARSAAVAEAARRVRGDHPPGRGLDRAAVRALADGGHEIGFHTRRHPSLVALDDDELATAVTAGRDELGEVAGRPCTTIAYPYGHADTRVAGAAAAAGIAYGFTLEPDATLPGSEPLLLGRVAPSFLSTRTLGARLALALVRGWRRSRGDNRAGG